MSYQNIFSFIKILRIVLLCSFLGGISFASDLTAEGYLNKLSKSIRGHSPDPGEYQQLKVQQTQQKVAEFFGQKINEYLKSPEHVEFMNYRLEELFQLKVASKKQNWFKSKSVDENTFPLPEFVQNSTVALFKSLAQENRSWDDLLVSKNYTAYPYDYGFFGAVSALPKTNIDTLGQLTPTTETAPYSLHFDSADSRLAGVITTKRFFDRYGTTALNKNRKRAAAIFRVFLCDSMAAAVPASHDKYGDFIDYIFPSEAVSGMNEEQIRALVNNSDKKHGEQADCMTCHYKLDPLGQTLRTSSLALNEQPSAGALIFKNSKAEIVKKEAQGIGDIAKALIEQPEYARCQVQHFWNWFIGSDLPLTDVKADELVQTFNRLNRKTNDFVSYLVQRPEFKQKPVSDPQQLLVQDIKLFFRKCDSCHNGKEDSVYGPIPTFASWPISGSKNQMSFWVDLISESLDLEHGGQKRTMPPSPDGFRPSVNEILKVKQWINEKMPDGQGNLWGQP